MRILLDECTPLKLKRDLLGHDVLTVLDAGWAGITIGELLRLAAQSFDALITVDRGLPYQQNLEGIDLVVITLVAASNRLASLKPAMPSVLALLEAERPGDILHVDV